MKAITYRAVPYQLKDGRWKPKAEVIVPGSRVAQIYPVPIPEDTFFDNEKDAKEFSENSAKSYIAKHYK